MRMWVRAGVCMLGRAGGARYLRVGDAAQLCASSAGEMLRRARTGQRQSRCLLLRVGQRCQQSAAKLTKDRVTPGVAAGCWRRLCGSAEAALDEAPRRGKGGRGTALCAADNRQQALALVRGPAGLTWQRRWTAVCRRARQAPTAAATLLPQQRVPNRRSSHAGGVRGSWPLAVATTTHFRPPRPARPRLPRRGSSPRALLRTRAQLAVPRGGGEAVATCFQGCWIGRRRLPLPRRQLPRPPFFAEAGSAGSSCRSIAPERSGRAPGFGL